MATRVLLLDDLETEDEIYQAGERLFYFLAVGRGREILAIQKVFSSILVTSNVLIQF